jgi:hypothetical protein
VWDDLSHSPLVPLDPAGGLARRSDRPPSGLTVLSDRRLPSLGLPVGLPSLLPADRPPVRHDGQTGLTVAAWAILGRPRPSGRPSGRPSRPSIRTSGLTPYLPPRVRVRVDSKILGLEWDFLSHRRLSVFLPDADGWLGWLTGVLALGLGLDGFSRLIFLHVGMVGARY